MTQILQEELNNLLKEQTEIEKELNKVNFFIQLYGINRAELTSKEKQFQRKLNTVNEKIKEKNLELFPYDYLQKQQMLQQKRNEMNMYLQRNKTSTERRKIKSLRNGIINSNKGFRHFLKEDPNLLTDALSLLSNEKVLEVKKEILPIIQHDSNLYSFLLETSIRKISLSISTKKPTNMSIEERNQEQKELTNTFHIIKAELTFARQIADGIKQGPKIFKQIEKKIDLKKFFAMEANELQSLMTTYEDTLNILKKRISDLSEHTCAEECMEKEKMTELYHIQKQTAIGQNKIQTFLDNLLNIEANGAFVKEIDQVIKVKDEVKLTELTLLAEDAVRLLSPEERLEVVPKCVSYSSLNELLGGSDVIFELLNEAN